MVADTGEATDEPARRRCPCTAAILRSRRFSAATRTGSPRTCGTSSPTTRAPRTSSRTSSCPRSAACRSSDREIAFKPWVYEIAKNACIDQLRRTRRASEVSIDSEDFSPVDEGRMSANVATDRRRLLGARGPRQPEDGVQRPSRAQREMLVCRELEGLSYDKISNRTGLSRSAVESMLFRARRTLKDGYDDIATGERCQRMQTVMMHLTDGRIGLRQERRLVRPPAGLRRLPPRGGRAGARRPRRRRTEPRKARSRPRRGSSCRSRPSSAVAGSTAPGSVGSAGSSGAPSRAPRSPARRRLVLAAAVHRRRRCGRRRTKDRRDRQGRGSGPRHPSGQELRQRRIIPGSGRGPRQAALQKVGQSSGNGSGDGSGDGSGRARTREAPGGGSGGPAGRSETRARS